MFLLIMIYQSNLLILDIMLPQANALSDDVLMQHIYLCNILLNDPVQNGNRKRFQKIH